MLYCCPGKQNVFLCCGSCPAGSFTSALDWFKFAHKVKLEMTKCSESDLDQSEVFLKNVEVAQRIEIPKRFAFSPHCTILYVCRVKIHVWLNSIENQENNLFVIRTHFMHLCSTDLCWGGFS